MVLWLRLGAPCSGGPGFHSWSVQTYPRIQTLQLQKKIVKINRNVGVRPIKRSLKQIKEPFEDLSAHHYVWDLFRSCFKWIDYGKKWPFWERWVLTKQWFHNWWYSGITARFFAGIGVTLEKDFYGYVRQKMAIIQNTHTKDNNCWQECRETGSLVHCWGEYKMGQSL